MDTLDYQILKMLGENARVKASDISKEVHLSVSTVIERIHKLEDAGIIEQYTIKANAAKLGNTTTALVEVSLEHPRYNESFAKEVCEHANIVACYYVTGDFDYLLKLSCRSPEHMEEIHKWIKNLSGVRATSTHFVLETVKNDGSILAGTENN